MAQVHLASTGSSHHRVSHDLVIRLDLDLSLTEIKATKSLCVPKHAPKQGPSQEPILSQSLHCLKELLSPRLAPANLPDDEGQLNSGYTLCCVQ